MIEFFFVLKIFSFWKKMTTHQVYSFVHLFELQSLKCLVLLHAFVHCLCQGFCVVHQTFVQIISYKLPTWINNSLKLTIRQRTCHQIQTKRSKHFKFLCKMWKMWKMWLKQNYWWNIFHRFDISHQSIESHNLSDVIISYLNLHRN